MTLIYSVILCLFFKAGSSQLPCVKETLNEKEFSINVTSHIQAKFGECMWIPYELTLPKNTVPYRKYLFKGDPQNTVDIKYISSTAFGTKDSFRIKGLPHEEHEFGFKLEWGCNQTYIFPKRVRISVSELTERPNIWPSFMTEGQSARLTCTSDLLCDATPKFHWEWTKADGQSTVFRGSRLRCYGDYCWHDRDILELTPLADDHNTNITCVADYGHSVIKTTVTLTVEFPPKIQNGSQCMVEGKLVVCVCISRGNPLPLITWPWASLTNYSVTRYSSIQTVRSTITMLAADYNTTKCISSNKLGRAEIELPLQNHTGNYWLGPKSDAALPWIIAGVSLSLNLVLLTTLIICIYKRGKSQQRKPSVEMNTYASLNQADVGQEYSVISPRTRGVSRECPGVTRDTQEI